MLTHSRALEDAALRASPNLFSRKALRQSAPNVRGEKGIAALAFGCRLAVPHAGPPSLPHEVTGTVAAIQADTKNAGIRVANRPDEDKKMKRGSQRLRLGEPSGQRAGMTLVEVCIAMALVALLCGGLYAVGLKARQFAEHNRLATEARSLAKERLEEMVSYGAANLAKPTCTLANSDTNHSSLGYDIVRQPVIVWHAADGSVVGSTNAVYAEARVNVTYTSPLIKRQRTDSFSMLVEK